MVLIMKSKRGSSGSNLRAISPSSPSNGAPGFSRSFPQQTGGASTPGAASYGFSNTASRASPFASSVCATPAGKNT